MRISDWSSDVCSSDLIVDFRPFVTFQLLPGLPAKSIAGQLFFIVLRLPPIADRWRWYLIYHAQNRKTTAWHDAVGWGCGRHVNTGRTPEWISRSISNSLFRSCRSRSEEHTSELQSLMRNSYAVFCLKKKNI